jgi:hypothetical protein
VFLWYLVVHLGMFDFVFPPALYSLKCLTSFGGLFLKFRIVSSGPAKAGVRPAKAGLRPEIAGVDHQVLSCFSLCAIAL